MLNYLKSSISISSYDGCTIGCKYCILSALEDRNKVKKVANEEELVEELLEFRLYTKEIPISINNQTDPFLNREIFNSTLKILEIMQEKEVKNPILIITKGYVTNEELKKLSNINLNIIILYTFSGLSEKLENRNEKKQIDTMKKLSKLDNIKLVNYYRPVIEGLNSDEKLIKKVVSIVTKYCEATIISGIRINTHLNQMLKNELKINLPQNYDPDHKMLLPDTYKRIKDIFIKKKNKYPVFKKTSCGISYILGQPDYNGHSARIYYCNPRCISYPICIGTNKIGFCDKDCPNYKICEKESKKKITNFEFKKILNIIKKDANFEIKENYIKLEGTYWQEEVSYMRHMTKKNIKADKLLKRKDEFLISK